MEKLHIQLINGRFGDPLIYCLQPHLGRAFCFDMGASVKIANKDLQRIESVYLSHAHVDHVFGFDNFLRANLKLHRRIEIFGPAGIQKNIQGKLQGFTWNLVDGYGLVFDVYEILSGKLVHYRLLSKAQFRLKKMGVKKIANEPALIQSTDLYDVYTSTLDHRIPSQAYALVLRAESNIDSQALKNHGYLAGAWLQELKAQKCPSSLSVPLQAGGSSKIKTTLLKKQLLQITPAKRLVYVTDVGESQINQRKIHRLAKAADLLLCESTFTAADSHKAQETYHLTAATVGRLAKTAQVKALSPFHFSKKYMDNPQPLIDELQTAYGNKIADESIYL